MQSILNSRILKHNGLGKLLKISPRPYRHDYQRFVNAQFPIFPRLRMTRGRLTRITNFRYAILNFAESHASLINKMEGRWKLFFEIIIYQIKETNLFKLIILCFVFLVNWVF